MKRLVDIFCPLALVIANSCAMAAVFSLLSIVENMENTDPGLLIWLTCLIICYSGIELIFRRQRSERALIIFCVVCFLLQAILIFATYGRFSSNAGTIAAVAMWMFSYFSCYTMAIEKISAEKIVRSFDVCSLVLIFLLLFCSVKEQSLILALPLGAAMVLCLFALVLIRGGEQRKGRSLGISAGLIGVFGLAAALLVALASGGIRKFLDVLSTVISAVLNFIFRLIETIFRLISKLFPDKQYDSAYFDALDNMSVGTLQNMDFKLIDAETLIIITVGFGIIIAAAMIVYRLIKGDRKLHAIGADGKKIRRSKLGLLSVIKKAFSGLYRTVSLRIKAFLYRNTSQGLFWKIEKRSRKKLRGRAENESCREFLLRAMPVYPWAENELLQLADTMDEISFGAGMGLETKTIVAMKRKIFSQEKGK